LIIVVGVGIFGTLNGYLANQFLHPAKPSEQQADEVPDVQQRLAALRDLFTQQRAIAELETMLERKAP
jgi:hypothetical protein